MCGIAGIMKPGFSTQVSAMVDSMGHRGPDARGVCDNATSTLGHARLSIIDIAGGSQPMANPHDQSWIVFNGEIYNFPALREQMGAHTFATKSDTEVILRLFQEQGLRHVRDLDGMFAYAIVKGDDVVLSRDPLGIKPLYTGMCDDTLMFASEIKTLLPLCDRIEEFPAGHIYSSAHGWQRYYHLDMGEGTIRNAEEAASGVRTLLENAVRKRLLADVPVGVFLSGGLDSSLIAALARLHKDPLDSFSVGTNNSPDREFAHCMARFLGTRHHEHIYTIDEAIAALPEVIFHLESFDCALVRSAVPNFFLARLASQHVKVALSGEGADELFCGYDYLKALDRTHLHAELLDITKALHNTNLQRCDRMSMAHSLEVRVPFLDIAVVDYAFQISVDLKLPLLSHIEKWVLRKAAEPLLPQEIVWREKLKFAAGAGLGEALERHAETHISDSDFKAERTIGKNLVLRSKEELLYYRIFCERFPVHKIAHLIGRSRSV